MTLPLPEVNNPQSYMTISLIVSITLASKQSSQSYKCPLERLRNMPDVKGSIPAQRQIAFVSWNRCALPGMALQELAFRI